VADRYSYIPCLSLALLAGGGILACLRAIADGRAGRATSWGVGGLTTATLLIFAGMTSAQISVWHDSTSLWQNAFDRHPIERLRRAGVAREADRLAYEKTITGLGNLSAYW